MKTYPFLIKHYVIKMYGGVEVYFHALLTLALGVICQIYAPATLSRYPMNKMIGELQR